MAIRAINKIIREKNIDVVQFMGNSFGIIPHRAKGAPSSIFISSLFSHGHPLRDFSLRVRLNQYSRIVASTHSMKRKLIEIGIPSKKLEVIPWGIDSARLKPDNDMAEKTKERLGIRKESKIILWSGFTQHISYNDFILSLGIAKAVIKRVEDCVFLFSFKKTNFKPEYCQYANERLIISKTNSNLEFLELINASRMYLAPTARRDIVVGPPLTWIESMSHGCPVVTTESEGVGELIKDEYTGYIFNSYDVGINKIVKALRDEDSLNRVSDAARQFVREKFEIKNSAFAYSSLWKSMVKEFNFL